MSPRARRLNLYFALLPHNAHAEDVVAFLEQLRRQVNRRLTVVWDGSNIHRKAKAVQHYLARHPKVVAKDLPPYAPEANPDELVWGWSKQGRLANLAANDTDELAENVVDELTYLQEHPHLLTSFVEKAALPLAA